MKKLVFAALALGLAASFSAYPQSSNAQLQGGKLDRKEAKALKDLADADLAEMAAGKIGAEKGQSQDVKRFGQKMQDDHGANLSELKALAQSKGVDLPAQPSKKHQAEAKKLQSASRFDQAYMDHMVKDHKTDVKKLSDATKSAKDPEVKAFLEKTRDAVQGHLQIAQQLDQLVKGGKSASAGSSSAKKAR